MYVSGSSSSSLVQTFKSKLRLTSEVLESARETLLKQLAIEDTKELVTDREVTEEEIDQVEEEPENELEDGIIVERNILLDAFLKYLENNEGITVKMSLLEGRVVIHEVPLGIYGIVAGEVTSQMRDWYNRLNVFHERDVIVDRNSTVIPDGSVQPRDLPRPPAGQGCDKGGVPYPTVVVEVGLSEGLKSLHSKARRYFIPRTTIQIYIAVKIFNPRRDGTRVLVAFVYERANPERPILVKSFGTAAMYISTLKFFRRRRVPDQDITGVGRHTAPPCNHLGIPIYQINIPATAIFNGSPTGIPANLGNGCNIDLYGVQEAFFSIL
ncbi:hypothetical protein RclHR1_00260034 [Rhizophagus clarus]|uniref:Uncharacterized protein n=1 Tax=Rhizophagus clarus TaxID=94130 RepID=A0A2Z6RDR9_9GLOM|nr:hypothetical protein RclHR1_00260034 [Rhizophagus clarus]GES97285.1 hypothetical protein GLOIN_2v1768213 [Rhizophagus clarus]